MQQNQWESFQADKNNYGDGQCMALTVEWIKKAMDAVDNGYGLNQSNILVNILTRSSVEKQKKYEKVGEAVIWRDAGLHLVENDKSYSTMSKLLNNLGNGYFSAGVYGKEGAHSVGIYISRTRSQFAYYDSNYGQIYSDDFRAFDKSVSGQATKAYFEFLKIPEGGEWKACEIVRQ